ncbi:MAG: TMEM165/GDT1 family protein [Thermodesulfobacteriota bacterium]|jgi:putative Ca2+/H+ antiporter (TMEM165/GDT1 family)
MKGLLVVFVSIFLAELGDKTQVATLLFATDRNLSRLGVFAASSAALVCSSLIAVLFGEQLARWVAPAALKLAAGVGFIAIGVWLLIDARA